jgi:hypothetical protein
MRAIALHAAQRSKRPCARQRPVLHSRSLHAHESLKNHDHAQTTDNRQPTDLNLETGSFVWCLLSGRFLQFDCLVDFGCSVVKHEALTLTNAIENHHHAQTTDARQPTDLNLETGSFVWCLLSVVGALSARR